GAWDRGAFAFGTSSSANPLPTADSVTPNSGTAAYQIFSAKYSDANGYAKLVMVNLLFRASPTSSVCWARYHLSDNKLYLQDDTGKVALGPVIPGSTGSVQNSQCMLSGTGSSAVGSGNTLTVGVAITFKSSFAGSKQILMYSADVYEQSSGWQNRGTWSVP